MAPKQTANSSAPPKKSTSIGMGIKMSGKCNPSPPYLGRNPYLNFLAEFRQQNAGLSSVDQVKKGAAEWRALPMDRKSQYIEAAKRVPRMQNKSKRLKKNVKIRKIPRWKID